MSNLLPLINTSVSRAEKRGKGANPEGLAPLQSRVTIREAVVRQTLRAIAAEDFRIPRDDRNSTPVNQSDETSSENSRSSLSLVTSASVVEVPSGVTTDENKVVETEIDRETFIASAREQVADHVDHTSRYFDMHKRETNIPSTEGNLELDSSAIGSTDQDYLDYLEGVETNVAA